MATALFKLNRVAMSKHLAWMTTLICVNAVCVGLPAADKSWSRINGRLVAEPELLKAVSKDFELSEGNSKNPTWAIDKNDSGLGGVVVALVRPSSIHPDLAVSKEDARKKYVDMFSKTNGHEIESSGPLEINGRKIVFPTQSVEIIEHAFFPDVICLRLGQPLVIANRDKELCYLRHMQDKDIALRLGGNEYYSYWFDSTHRATVVSPTHGHMMLSVYVFNHPYFCVTDSKGSFSIDQVPIGASTIIAMRHNKVIDLTTGRISTKRDGNRVMVASDKTLDLGTIVVGETNQK